MLIGGIALALLLPITAAMLIVFGLYVVLERLARALGLAAPGAGVAHREATGGLYQASGPTTS